MWVSQKEPYESGGLSIATRLAALALIKPKVEANFIVPSTNMEKACFQRKFCMKQKTKNML